MTDKDTQQSQARSNWTGWHSFSLLVIIVLIILAGLLIPVQARLWGWLIIQALMALFVVIAGQGVTGLWRGMLIDDRNKMGLSRLQMILWTIIVLSGFLVAALSNLATGQADPLAIAIPSQLWLLMGISTTSLVGSPLIKSTKKNKTPSEAEKGQTLESLAKQMGADSVEDTVTHAGQIVVHTGPEHAQWADMFKGEETGNAAHLDMAKIQMLFFTFVVALAYAVTLATLFGSDAANISALPALSQSIVALLGISHAGYLTHKAIPHSQTG